MPKAMPTSDKRMKSISEDAFGASPVGKLITEARNVAAAAATWNQ
jgi:hypothetical protein